MEQALRLLHSCGVPKADADMIGCDGPVMQHLLVTAQPRMTQFTGSSRVAEALSTALGGRVKLEDAGFDWKILGPDVGNVSYHCLCYHFHLFQVKCLGAQWCRSVDTVHKM
jgi:1-pyrroline-5-carboxylate dehydrogenase